jgi:hypothetical protein
MRTLGRADCGARARLPASPRSVLRPARKPARRAPSERTRRRPFPYGGGPARRDDAQGAGAVMTSSEGTRTFTAFASRSPELMDVTIVVSRSGIRYIIVA